MDVVAIIKSKKNTINSVNVQYMGCSFEYPYARNTKARVCICVENLVQQVQATNVLMILVQWDPAGSGWWVFDL